MKSTESNSSINYFTGGTDDKVNKVEKTPDGGFIYCGTNGGNSNNTQAFMLSVDAKGKQEWYKTYGGNKYDKFNHAIKCSDGGYLAVGSTNSIGTSAVDSNFNLMDYVVKTNANGEEEWSKSYFDKSDGSVFLTHIIESSDHYFYATGSAFTSANGYHVILLKLDFSGKFIFKKSFTAYSSYPPKIMIPAWREFGNSISFGSDGNLLIGGFMDNNTIGGQFGFLNLLISVKPNGGINFYYPYYANKMPPPKYVVGFSTDIWYTTKIANLSDGYLIASYVELKESKIAIQLQKTDLSGNVIWKKMYNGLGNSLLADINVNADGSITLLGASTAALMTNSLPKSLST